MTDRAVVNARKLGGVNFRRTYTEVFDRGRWNIAQFARDFLDIDLHPGQRRWMDSVPWADERYLASGNRFGKCVRKGTLIPLYNGGRVPIEKLPVGSVVWGMRPDCKLRPAQVRDKVCSGVKEVFRVTTASGREVDVTIEHPLLTVGGWVSLKDLRVDDYIAVPREYNNKNPYAYRDENGHRRVKDRPSWKLCRGARGKTIRRDKLLQIGEAFSDKEMVDLAQSDVLWDRIKSIEPMGEDEVWDLSINPALGHQNFVAGDIIVHNSWSAAVKCLHHCLYQTRHLKYASMTDRYVAINLSITLDMASIVWDQAYVWALDSPLYRKFLIENECKRTPFPTMVIGGGGKGRGTWRSELWARSTVKRGKYLLGKDFDFVNYDEAARDPDGPSVREDVLLMRLTDRHGRIDYTSTGNFQNWYYSDFIRARNEYDERGDKANLYAQTGSSYENPHIDHDKLKRNEERLGEEYRKQNIYGGFASGAIVFQPYDIEKCYRGQDYALPVAPVKKGEYVGGVDLGRVQDPTVILVTRIDMRPAQLVYAKEMGGPDVTWDDIYKEINIIHRQYNNAFFLIDSTAQAGDIHVQTLQNQYSMKRFEGYNFAGTSGKKKDLISVGQRALQGKWIVWPYIATLYDQLAFYDWDDKHLKTDWVMAWCLMAMAYQRETWIEDDMEEPVLVAGVEERVPGGVVVPVGPAERLANDYYGSARAPLGDRL